MINNEGLIEYHYRLDNVMAFLEFRVCLNFGSIHIQTDHEIVIGLTKSDGSLLSEPRLLRTVSKKRCAMLCLI